MTPKVIIVIKVMLNGVDLTKIYGQRGSANFHRKIRKLIEKIGLFTIVTKLQILVILNISHFNSFYEGITKVKGF